MTEGIRNISKEDKTSEIVLTWNSTQPSDTFLIVVCFGKRLFSSENLEELLSVYELPLEGEWTEANDIKLYHLSANYYKSKNGVIIKSEKIPIPSNLMVFYIKNGVVLLHDGENNQITLKNTIFYSIKKCFCFNIFSLKRKYIISLKLKNNQSSAFMNSIINCKVAQNFFPLTSRCFEEVFEVVAKHGILPQLILSENVKKYYTMRGQERK